MLGLFGVKGVIIAIGIAAVTALVGGGYLYVTNLQNKVATLTASAAIAQGAADAERAAREAIEADRARADAAVAEAIQKAAKRAVATNTIKQEVIHVPAPALAYRDCAPATSLVFDRLRHGGPPHSQAGSPEAEAAGKPSELRPGPGRP